MANKTYPLQGYRPGESVREDQPSPRVGRPGADRVTGPQSGRIARTPEPGRGPNNSGPGIVYLVGAGPGDPDLITVKGLKVLRSADVILHDRLCPSPLLAERRPDAEIIDVGKAPGQPSWTQTRINERIVQEARSGRAVVRLKGGDPFVFGRGGEEVIACDAAGVSCVVIPGVSSAVGVPASAGIPVTHRGVGRSVAVITGRTDGESDLPPHDYDALARVDTLVLLMGWANLRPICQALIGGGRDAQTPAACVASGTTPRQRVVTGTLATIADAAERAELEPPVTTIIGELARFAEARDWWPPGPRLTANRAQ